MCGGHLCRAVTVPNTLYKDQQVAMTSQDCPSGLPTTSSCQSWVRRLQSGFNATSLKKEDTHINPHISQGGASTTWARCAWGATSRLGSWWRSNRPTWMTAQRRSCCSSWCTAVLNGCFILFHETFPFHNCHIWFVSLNPERSSAFQTVPPPEPADLSSGIQFLLPALGPHPLDGLWSANSITLF